MQVDNPGRAVRIGVSTPDLPARPSSAVLAQEDTEVTIKPTEPPGRVEVTVTGEADLCDVARTVTELPWLERIQADSRQRSIELRGELGQISEVVPLASRRPDLTWWLAESEDRQPNWVRAPGAEFGGGHGNTKC